MVSSTSQTQRFRFGVVEDHYDNGQKYSEWRYKMGFFTDNMLSGIGMVKKGSRFFQKWKRVGLRIAWYSDGENAEIIYEDGEIKEKTVY